jgi:hypothetical protein
MASALHVIHQLLLLCLLLLLLLPLLLLPLLLCSLPCWP